MPLKNIKQLAFLTKQSRIPRGCSRKNSWGGKMAVDMLVWMKIEFYRWFNVAFVIITQKTNRIRQASNDWFRLIF